MKNLGHDHYYFSIMHLILKTIIFSAIFLYSIGHAQTTNSNPYGFQNIDFPNKLIRLGAGVRGSAFFPIAESICKIINKNTDYSKLRCVLVETPGAEFNVVATENDSFEVTITQGDNLLKMTAEEEDGPTPLRLLGLLGRFSVNLIVNQNINSISDLKGKVYNANSRGSASSMSGKAFLKAANLKESDFSSVKYLTPAEVPDEFCNKGYDFGIFVGAHPGPVMKRLMSCKAKLLQMPDDVLKVMEEEIPSSIPYTKPSGIYSPSDPEVKSITVPVILVTSKEVSNEAIYRLVTILKANYDKIYYNSPTLNKEYSTLKDMGEFNFIVHDGAIKALKTSN